MSDLENDVDRIVDEIGNVKYYLNGKFHRDNDLPAIIYKEGSKLWFINGLCHREGDLPAIIYDGYGDMCYYKYDKLHREVRVNGKLLPAVIYKNGKKAYYLNGVEVDENGELI
jgi:hypothetical protein